MNTKISVVVPTWQRPALLENCLIALCSQTFDAAELEIIIVTDGPDAATMRLVTKTVINEGLSNVSCVSMPQKCGPAAARNRGWHCAKGKLIAFTDDDTIPDEQWLQCLWDAYCDHGMPEHIAFTGKIKVPLNENPTDHEVNTAHLETAAFVTANCCCTKASLIRVGGFDESFTMAWREDSDLEFKLIHKKIPVYNVSGALVLHPVRNAPWGVSIKEQKKSMFNALLYKKYPSLYRQKIQAQPPWHYYIILISFFTLPAAMVFDIGWLMMLSAATYLLFTGAFVVKRLSRTSHAFPHVMEMVFTSLIIPFASVYWTLYGSWKYRVLFF